MKPEIIVALIGLLGVVIGAIPTYLFMRQKNLAEVDKLNAETDKIKAEAEKIRAEFQSTQNSYITANKVKVLFVAANPIDTSRLRLDDEVRSILEGIRKSNKVTFELDQAWSVRWDDLRSHLLRHTPDVLHISGHGSAEGIVLEGETGKSTVISTASINNLLSLFSDRIRLVFFNTMYSETTCKELAQNIDYVIGVGGALHDKQAQKFSGALYEALADGKDVRNAFEFARASLSDTAHASYQLFTFRKQHEKYFLTQPRAST